MFGSIKKAIAVGAVVAASAMVPAVASADQWTLNGSSAFAGASHVSGSLTTTLVATGTETTCDVTATLDLTNPGGVAHGVVTSFSMTNCTTTAANCTVTAVSNATPWTVDTSGTSVTITGASFTNTYGGGASCALNGASVTATSDPSGLTGTVSGDDIEFVGATGLTSPFGPLTLDGVVNATDEATGAPVTLF